MPGPYSELKIVEFGRFIAAPYCGQLFADGGADVIKIEPVHGDDARRNGTRLSSTEARQYLNKNRGKRSVAVKLSDPDILRAVHVLVEDADVVIANFRPGLAEKLGFDYATLSRNNERLIYAENTAFGKAGDLAGKPGMDLVLQGHTGVAPVFDDAPRPLGDPIIDYSAAMLMAWGIASALYHRERTGVGQCLDVSLLQAALVIQNNSVNHIDAVDGWRDEFVSYLKDAFARGCTFAEIVAHRDTLKPAITPPYYGFFRTRDGLIALAAGGRALQQRVARTLGLDDPALADDGFVPPDIAAHTQAMRGQTSEKIALETTGHWLSEFERIGVPAGPVMLKDQLLDDPQSWDNAYLVRLEHEEVGGMTVVGPPVKFAATPLQTTTASPPLGRHTDEVLKEAGLTEEDIERLLARNAATVWQGSTDN